MTASTSVPGSAPRQRTWRGELHRLGPLLVLALGVAAVLGSVALSLGKLTAPGPGLWPFLVACLLTGTSAVLLVVDDPADYEAWTGGTARIVGGLVGLAVFILAFATIGFVLPAFVMLLLWLRVFGGESWSWALALAVLGSVGMHLLFVEVLGVPFPDGLLAGIGVG